MHPSSFIISPSSLPENVNYAVKSSLLLSFLESVPDVDAKLKEPNTKEESFEVVVKSAQAAAVLVLVYGADQVIYFASSAPGRKPATVVPLRSWVGTCTPPFPSLASRWT